MRLVKEDHDNWVEGIDSLQTIVPRQALQMAYLHRIQLDNELAERRLDKLRKEEQQVAADARFRCNVTLIAIGVFLLLLASIAI